jgi:hypothetical protein
MELPLLCTHKIKFRGKPFFFLIISFILSLPVFSQPNTPVMGKLADRLNALAQNCPAELAYIQTSKGIYEAGEDLWFKAYLLDAHYFIPSALSQTLYLQMVNENTNQVVWKEKYEVKNGFADGHVFLRDSLSEGDYLVEAYTPHSFFNDSTAFCATRKIILRKDMNPHPPVAAYLNRVFYKKGKPIQFGVFPEGGNLVAGLPSSLAFKAVNIDGNPLDVTGTLFEDGTPLLEFKSIHAGMGRLNFTPLAGKKYHIRLSTPQTDRTFLLPEVYPEGITMRLDGQDKEYLEFIVSQSPGQEKRTVYLRGQLRGVVCCMATGVLNKELKIKIPLKEFPGQGIAEFTLFNENQVPVAERLVYVNPDKKLYIEAKLSKDKYETRQKATLKIKLTDQNGQPVVANLGVSVYDKLYQDQRDPKTILTHCYLSSQLKGKIYDPAWYFDSRNKGREEALDLLLLTQGWRRYVWGEENLKIYEKANLPFIFDGTKGEVHATKKLKKAQVVDQFVMAFNLGENKNSDLIITDSTGRFTVAPVHLKTWQGGYVYLKPLGSPEFEPRISLTDPFQTIEAIRKFKDINYPLPNSADTAKEMAAHPYVVGPLNEIELGEVTVMGKKINPFRDKYMGHLDSLAKLDLCMDYVGKCGVINCPACESVGKPVERKKYAKWVSKRNPGGHPYAFSANEMETILKYQYPKLTEEELLKMNNLSRVKAYYRHREFYQPNYDKGSDDYFSPDSRNTLLWAPSVVTNEKGEVALEFFCSDINTAFVGKIEGVSGDGLLGSKDVEFTVLKMKPFKWER